MVIDAGAMPAVASAQQMRGDWGVVDDRVLRVHELLP